MHTVNHVVLPEVREALKIIVEHVRNHNVKNLLVDAGKTEVDVSEESYASMVAEFSLNLKATRLKKLAHIVTPSPVRENAVKKVYRENKLSIEFQNFTDLASAIEWLES